MRNTRSQKSLNLIDHLYDQSRRSNSWTANRSRYLQRRFDSYSNLYSQEARGHSGCVNALDFSSDGRFLASGGDDKRILLWNMSEVLFHQTNRTPTALSATHLSNIFSIRFANQNRRIISAGNDEQILVHDVEKQNLGGHAHHSDELVDVFLESSPINCISIQPNQNEVFLAATEDGHVHLYDLRSASTAAEHDQPTAIVAESFDGSYHSCAFNPQQTNFVATANARQGIELYDLRLCKSPVLRYGASKSTSNQVSTAPLDEAIEGMSVTFNRSGSLLYALRRRLPPVLFKLNEARAFCQFDADNYVNLCTMKAGCFVGDSDQYVASGSDDFNVYIWRVPDAEETKTIEQPSASSHLSSDHFVWNAHLILRGHRSVVNQVRYSSRLHTLVSSGVEKVIKMWTPYPTRNTREESQVWSGRQRMYSAEDYLNAVYGAGSIHHDSSSESYDEDKRMLAFFDSLLQRELNGEEDDESDEDYNDLYILDTSDDDDDDDDDVSIENEEETTVDELDVENSTTSYSNDLPRQRDRPTIESLAKNYRLQYVEKIKELNGIPANQAPKRPLASPTMMESKRSCSSRSNSNENTLQILRNRVRREENEQLFFNDERRM